MNNKSEIKRWIRVGLTNGWFGMVNSSPSVVGGKVG